MFSVIKGATILCVATLGIIAFGLFLSLPVMWLWNDCLIPATSGLKEITWLQAWGIMVLCGLLFKSTQTSSS